jgi:RHS repeat-associated protein
VLVVAVGLAPAMAQAQTEVVEYYGLDAIGSIRVVFDASGAVVARTDYLPFGENVQLTGALPPWQFTGQIRDSEAGQDDFGARRYQPRHGRFTAVDPVYAGLFDPQQWNRYAYARSSPLHFVDRDGRALLAVVELRDSRERRSPLTGSPECTFGGVERQWPEVFRQPAHDPAQLFQEDFGRHSEAAAGDPGAVEPGTDPAVVSEESGLDATPRSCRQELAAWRLCVQECREAKWGEAVWDGAYNATKNVGSCFLIARTRAVSPAGQMAVFAACAVLGGFTDAMNTWNKAATFGDSCTQKCGPSPTCIGAP